jgi:hypothetical protein
MGRDKTVGLRTIEIGVKTYKIRLFLVFRIVFIVRRIFRSILFNSNILWTRILDLSVILFELQ